MKSYRTEWKFQCPQTELSSLAERLSHILELDSHSNGGNFYEIHSLYFDDYKNTCARENEGKVSKRYKYRIRYYGADKGVIKLEKKEKLYGRCHKESYRLSQEECMLLMDGQAGEVFWNTNSKLLKTFCVEIMTRDFRPKAIVDYERTAFIEPISNVRITIDRNISVSDETECFLDGGYLKIPLQSPNTHVLEVKFDYILPGYIKQIITNDKLLQTNFSKYYFGRKKLQEMRGNGLCPF